MREFKAKIFLLGFVFLFSFIHSSKAYAMGAQVVPMVIGTFHNELVPSQSANALRLMGVRSGLRVDFMSIENNVSINLTTGFGLGYYDLGLQLRLFNFWQGPFSYTRGILYYGIGFGFVTTPGVRDVSTLTRTKWSESNLSLFLRYLWNRESAWGTQVELAYEPMYNRSVGSSGGSGSNTAHRFLIGLGIAIDAEH
jgi:hypothetical protein